MPSEGILIKNPYTRMTDEQISQIHGASIKILDDPGLISYNKEAIEILGDYGAAVDSIVSEGGSGWHVRIPEKLVTQALGSAPKEVVLGARNKDNALILKAEGRELDRAN